MRNISLEDAEINFAGQNQRTLSGKGNVCLNMTNENSIWKGTGTKGESTGGVPPC